MSTLSADPTTPEAARDAGMQAAELAADPRKILMVDKAIADANASGREWSANTIRDQLPVTSQGLVGARVRAALMRGDMVPVRVDCPTCGTQQTKQEPSSLPNTHGKPVLVYVGVNTT